MEAVNPNNNDLAKGDESLEDSVVLAQECNNCEEYRTRYLESKRENLDMKKEVARLTEKMDNIRRLQEMGMLNSFRKWQF